MSVNLSMKILIVDDYSTIRRILRNMLSQLGFHDVDEAADGSSALVSLREQHYGLVIAAWNTEPMTGLQLLQAIRSDAKLSATPFVIVTSGGRIEDPAVAKAAGANACIAKPFNAATLKQTLVTALGNF